MRVTSRLTFFMQLMSFLSVKPFQMLARHIRRTFRPLVFFPGTIQFYKFIYDTAGVLITMCIINILSVAFNLLYWKPSTTAWIQIYYIHYWIGIVGYLIW
jgi:lysophospholipid acyltransferase